jgi:gag-polypeptide of LTR copia-type
MARDRGLYSNLIGIDLIPLITDPAVSMTASMLYIGTIPLAQLTDEWNNRNNTAHKQILLCISPELQTAFDEMDQAKNAWDIIINKFKSTDPSKINIIRTKYKNYHMIDSQSAVTYLTTMKEYRNQLTKNG